MSEGQFHVITEEQRERLQSARRSGGMCAACGRTLDVRETAYIERFLLGVRVLRGSTVVTYASAAFAPVGVECASSDLLGRTAGAEPERCAGCGRGVYYHSVRATRRQALCSRRCIAHAATTRRIARAAARV